MPDSMISISASDHSGTFNAYIAMPEVTSAPVVILIQEIFGINQDMREKCDEMAAQGYIAIAPDLFWRIEPGIDLVDSVPEQLERAFELFGLFDTNKGIEDLKATLDAARALPECSGKVGCAGYCLGGFLAFAMAVETDIDAAVSYYGVNIPSMLSRTDQITKPLMLHIAGNDEFVPPEDQNAIKSALSSQPHIHVHIYEGQNHAFARAKGMHYDKEAANLANGRTEGFLVEALK